MQPGDIRLAQIDVAALLARHWPALAHLPRRAVTGGTDTHLIRLGSDHVLRLPRRPAAEAGLLRETQWLPLLQGALPVPVPEVLDLVQWPLRAGQVVPVALLRWISGQRAGATGLGAGSGAALAGFLGSLRSRPLPPDAPAVALPQLAAYDGFLRRMLAEFPQGEQPDLLRLWQGFLPLEMPMGPPVWCHGDLHGYNLLQSRGHLCGVIDWAVMGKGSAAVDLMAGWTLEASERQAFLRALGPDPAHWHWARGLAFAKAVMAIPWYRRRNPGFAAMMAAVLRRVVAAPE